MKNKLELKICKRCVMDQSDPLISFTHSGCNHCDTYFNRVKVEIPNSEPERETKLRILVNKIKKDGRKKQYDCVIGVSGGVDSTSVALNIKKLGLRPIAVHLDNGWNSELAVWNIQETLRVLKIPLKTHVINWQEFRDLQKSFIEADVPNCEIPTDHAIGALLIKTALKHRIKYILHGGNVQTEAIMPISWGWYNQDLKHINDINKKFYKSSLSSYPKINIYQYLYAFTIRRLKFIPILNYLNYNKTKAKQYIIKELNWRDYGGKHFESIFTRFFQGYYLPQKFGFDKRKAHLSCLVCAGEITRKEALKILSEPCYDINLQEKDLAYVRKKLKYDPDVFNSILKRKPKLHTEYKTNKFLLEDMEKLKKIFKTIVTNV